MIGKLLSPSFFKSIPGTTLPILWICSIALCSLGLYYGLLASPPDYRQGDYVRIMYVHVPSAWMALGIYSFIALCSFLSIVWKNKIAYPVAASAAPAGAAFSLIVLVTGSLWGKPVWGAWWVWDARLTSAAILFLFYLIYIAVSGSSGKNLYRAERPASVIALIGFVNVPAVKFSVDLWYSLHQPASFLRLEGPSVHKSMLPPLFLVFGGFVCYFIALTISGTKIFLARVKNNGSSRRN